MKKNDFIKIIEAIVRKEVKKQVNDIFINKEQPPLELSDITDVVDTKPRTKYSKNEAINKVLNETKGGLSQGRESYPTMGSGTFDSTRMREIMGHNKSPDSMRELSAAQTANAAGVDLNKVPESVVNALTRDYSDLMKVINKDK
jgi:hypothetical protein